MNARSFPSAVFMRSSALLRISSALRVGTPLPLPWPTTSLANLLSVLSMCCDVVPPLGAVYTASWSPSPAVHLAVSADLPDSLRPPHLPGSETQYFCVGRLDPSACDARGLVGSGCLYKQFYGRNHHQEQDCLRSCGTLQELDRGLTIFSFDRPLLLQIVQSPQADLGHLG